jgi:hypothetical protein
MRRLALLAAATLAATLATPALADAPPPTGTYLGASGDPCTAGFTSPNAIACQGYYSGNLDGNSDSIAFQQSAIQALLSQHPTDPNPQLGYVPTAFSWDGDWNALVNAGNVITSAQLVGNQLVFSTPLFGQTIIGAHFGNNAEADQNNVTAFWLFNFTAPTSGITFDNLQGFSNAALYQTQPGGVPEPGTWAMMLLGFGATGVAMRRRRQPHALAQLA